MRQTQYLKEKNPFQFLPLLAGDEDVYGLDEDEADALRKHSGGDKHPAPAEATHFNSHHEAEEEEA